MVRTPKHDTIFFFKLYFECTNNIAEYEALILGPNALKDMKERRISVYGDSELIINQVKGIYQTKHPRMRDYRNLVLTGVKIPRNKGRHCPFHKSQLDS